MTAPQIPWHQRLETFPAWIPKLIFLLGVALLPPSIWSETSITASDEYVLTFRAPMEMQERGQFLTPYRNEEPRFRKPPLRYWLILGAGLVAREMSRFPTLNSRKAWARFACHDASAPDWLAAFRNRSLDDLRSQFQIFETTRPG